MQSIESDAILESLMTFPSILGMTSYPLLMGYNSHSDEGCQTPPLDEDCSCLANMFGTALEEELATLARYTRHAMATLALGGIGH